MKKQINRTIKAQLIRSTFYVLSLLAACVIPCARAHWNTIKRNAPTLDGPCSLNPWRFVAPYPAGPVEEPAVGSDGTVVYAAGGFSDSTFAILDVTYKYDPRTNTWTQLDPGLTFSARLDTPGVHARNVNRFYVFGGVDSSFSATNTTQIYDPVRNSWITGAAMPGARFFPGIAYSNGKIYIIGGFDSTGTETSTTWEYDPVSDTWDTSRAPIPLAMSGAGTAENSGNIYLMGAWNGGLGSTLNYEYNIAGDTWTQKADIPAHYYTPGAVQLSGLIYLIAGGDPYVGIDSRKVWLSRIGEVKDQKAPLTSYNTTRIYNPATNRWSVGPTLNHARWATAAVAVGNSVFVVGGYNGDGDTDSVETSDCTSGEQTSTPSPDRDARLHAALVTLVLR